MYVRGSGTIGDLLGDLVAYRSLRPRDPRLASVQPPPVPPRKIEPAYGAVVGDLLREARQISAPVASIRRIIVIGDNAPTDGAAFEHLCAANGWEGYALLVDEQPQNVTQSRTGQVGAIVEQPGEPGQRQLMLSHWAQLREWALDPGATSVDEQTVVLVDIDKTLLGARGRNDGVIDTARAIAMREAVASLLGSAFRSDGFEAARQIFNRREYQSLTGDNQDYVAYICLIIASGAWTVDELRSAVDGGTLRSPADLVAFAEAATGPDAARLRAVHRPIAERIARGDPTPFKEFRVREYLETTARMRGQAAANGEPDLASELVLTAEVLDVARLWQAQGALIFALSDKPDEASIPPDELQVQGHRSLHWTPARIVDSNPVTDQDSATAS